MKTLIALLVTPVLLSCAATREIEKPDPRHAEVPLPAAAGWTARLVYEGDAGVWTVGTLDCFSSHGCPDVFGLDDRGRCTILTCYSGKWTPFQTTEDGAWLGALAQADLDPTMPEDEIYVGGKSGNLYQIQPRDHGGFDVRVMAHLAGEEIHTLVAGDLLPERDGDELLVFTRRGDVLDMRFRPADRRFEAVPIDRLEGRVRQAILLPTRDGEKPWIAVATRYGEIALLRMESSGLEKRTVTREPMGFGRIALRPGPPGAPLTLYASRDDGLVLRYERTEDGAWRREAVYAGPQGPRGVAAGRFHADPDVESIAVFGYSKRVQLLTRTEDRSWKVETVYEAVDKGHWLGVAELDGRNSTDELIGSGYGKRVFLLSRPPGYGSPDLATDPGAAPEPRLGAN